MGNSHKIPLKNFDEKNGLPALSAGNAECGLLGLDRDCYLSLIQYISSKNLRNYVGLSEESFQRGQHSYYHFYRNKYNQIPLRKLLLHPKDIELTCFDRTLINRHMQTKSVILKETLLGTICELKLKYTGYSIMVHNINAIYEHLRSGTGIRTNMKKIEIVGANWEKGINTKGLIEGSNEISVILNMLEGFNTMQFKLNGVLLPHMICDIPHNKRQFKIDVGYRTEAIVISTTHLKHPPVKYGVQYRYYDAKDGGYY
jgi:hypothetical protein